MKNLFASGACRVELRAGALASSRGHRTVHDASEQGVALADQLVVALTSRKENFAMISPGSPRRARGEVGHVPAGQIAHHLKGPS